MAPIRDEFFEALRDDFNTPRAVAALAAWVSEANRREGVGRDQLVEMLDVFGLAALASGGAEADGDRPDDAALALLEARNAARAAKDWAEADRLRDELTAAGWTVRDGPDGAELIRA
jgi:cysteinyl-tRNA synthetase